MKKFVTVAALAAFVLIPNLASAREPSEQIQAVRLCRAEIAQQTGLESDDIRLDQVRLRAQFIRVDLDVWNGSTLQNVRCDVSRGDTLTVASIDPALASAQATPTAAQGQ